AFAVLSWQPMRLLTWRISCAQAECRLSGDKVKCRTLSISAPVAPPAPARVIARAVEMLYGEKIRFLSFCRRRAYRSRPKRVLPSTTAATSCAGAGGFAAVAITFGTSLAPGDDTPIDDMSAAS